MSHLSAAEAFWGSEDSAESIIVLVIAHPDDESMFFLPTMVSIRSDFPAAKLWILCCTRGNYDHLGSVRIQELQKVCDLLDVDELIQVDRLEMQDNPSRYWSIPDASRIIEGMLMDALKRTDLKEICVVHFVTFDEGGVSGHVNHRDCYRSVRHMFPSGTDTMKHLMSKKRVVGMHLWTLETVRNPLRKYLPIREWIALLRYWLRRNPHLRAMNPSHRRTSYSLEDDSQSLTFRLRDPALNWKAMSMHSSQFVWYRRLFVVFSCYSYVNRLRLVRSVACETGGQKAM